MILIVTLIIALVIFQCYRLNKLTNKTIRDINTAADSVGEYREMKEKQPLILIVEDELIIALSVKTYLEQRGFKVVGITDSAEGVFAWFKSTLIPEIILMDVNIKGDIPGDKLAEEVYSKYQVPSILVTAHMPYDIGVASNAIISYLAKPFKNDTLGMILTKYFYSKYC